jgi:hypothetical protein
MSLTTDRQRSRPAARRSKNLLVREIDAARQFDEIRARYASSIEALFDRFAWRDSGVRLDLSQDRAVLQSLIDLAPPGSMSSRR